MAGKDRFHNKGKQLVLKRQLYFEITALSHVAPLKECGVKNVMVLATPELFACMQDIRKSFHTVAVRCAPAAGWRYYHVFLLDSHNYYDWAFQYTGYTIQDCTISMVRHKANRMETEPVILGDWQNGIPQLPKDAKFVGLGYSANAALRANREFAPMLPDKYEYYALDEIGVTYPARVIAKSVKDWVNAYTVNSYKLFQVGKAIPKGIGGNPESVDDVMEYYKDENAKCGIKELHDSLLKLPIAHFYIPLCKYYNSYDVNFTD